jgi:uracil-DNA glycosylase family 4
VPPRPTPILPQTLIQAQDAIVACQLCPRLRSYCQGIGETRRRAYIDQEYWARPVPGFGAHGANRTGRPFTGDGSGDFLYPVLHSLGFASQPAATHRQDGLKLRHAYITSVVRCAPPGDKPTPGEIRACAAHLSREIAALPKIRVVVCLGKIAWDGYLNHLLREASIERRSAYPFGHGREHQLSNGLSLLGSYHPSLRNTNTGRLHVPMLTRVFTRARELAHLSAL